jgi:Flp pilus assembly protein TadB
MNPDHGPADMVDDRVDPLSTDQRLWTPTVREVQAWIEEWNAWMKEWDASSAETAQAMRALRMDVQRLMLAQKEHDRERSGRWWSLAQFATWACAAVVAVKAVEWLARQF